MRNRVKSILALLLCFVLMAGLLPGALAAGDDNPFTDVKESDYFYDAVVWAYENNVTKGTSDTAFSPWGACTRGQVVTFLWRAMGQPKPKTAENPFSDVPETAYYRDAVLWAVEQGITNGTGKDAFSPDSPCVYAHILTFIWRSVTGHASSSYGEWYTEPMDWADGQGLLPGTALGKDGNKVMVNCPRCDVVTYLWRALEAEPQENLVPFGEAHGWTFSQPRGLVVPEAQRVTGDFSSVEYHPVEATLTAPVITCTLPDAEGCVTYTIACNYTLGIDFVIDFPDQSKSDETHWDWQNAFSCYFLCDYYTGTYLYTSLWTTPEEPVVSVDLESTIVYGGVEYPVYYSARAESDWSKLSGTRSGNRVFYNCSYDESYTMTFRVPQDYDGLVMGIDYKTMPEIPDEKNVVYPEFWDQDDDLDNLLFIRLSDYRKCGENLTCTFDGEGTLTVSGAGDMEDYDLNVPGLPDSFTSAWHLSPWSYYSDRIRSVVIEPGVTRIGDNAFANCQNLTSITIPNTVTEIGKNAFYGTKPTDIMIPSSVKSIADSAFLYSHIGSFQVSGSNPAYCAVDGVLMTKDGKRLIAYPSESDRSSYTIPDTVTGIAESAFSYARLENVTIPAGVTEISGRAFAGSQIKEFKVSPDNSEYSAVDGVLMTKDGKRLIAYPSESDRSSYTIPDTVTEIEDLTFTSCRSLTSITIPASVKEFSYFALPTLGLTDIYYAGGPEEWDELTKDWPENQVQRYAGMIHYHSNGSD